MLNLPSWIQRLILFSTGLGAFFLWLAHPLVPANVFYILLTGWLLFVVDSALTILHPKIAYYLGLVLAVATLSETLAQPEHYALVANGNVAATVVLVLGSVSQAMLILLTGYYIVRSRKEDPWAWPGEDSPGLDEAPAE